MAREALFVECWMKVIEAEASRVLREVEELLEDAMRRLSVGKTYKYVEMAQRVWRRIETPPCKHCGYVLCGGLAFSVGSCAFRIQRGELKSKQRAA